MAKKYIFMVASRQKWDLLDTFCQQNEIKKGDDSLFLLPLLPNELIMATPEERQRWIHNEILEVINEHHLEGDEITVFVHAGDVGDSPGLYERLQSNGVNRYILYSRDSTTAYKELTRKTNIESEDYLTNLEQYL